MLPFSQRLVRVHWDSRGSEALRLRKYFLHQHRLQDRRHSQPRLRGRR